MLRIPSFVSVCAVLALGACSPAMAETPLCNPATLAAAWSDSGVPVSPVGPDGDQALMPNQAVTLTLEPLEEVSFAAAPERAPKEGFAALVPIRVNERGVYCVTLDQAAWVDLVDQGALVPSVSHGMGEPCSGIRKFVDFPFSAGMHMIQLSGAKEPGIRLRITPAPKPKPAE